MKRWPAVLVILSALALLWFVAAAMVQGQDAVPSLDTDGWRTSYAPDPAIGWIKVEPFRQSRSEDLYGEIECRLSRNDSQLAIVPNDVKGTAHERTHFVNARVRNERKLNYDGLGQSWNAFYLYGGYAAIIKEPPITIRQVAAAVPKEHRGLMYASYCVDPKALSAWNDRPLYLLDEMVAYLNGAIVGFERGLGGADYDYRCAVEFQFIACALYEEVERLPPGAYNRIPLREFLQATHDYLVTVAGEAGITFSNVSQIFGRGQRPFECGPNGCPSSGGAQFQSGRWQVGVPMDIQPAKQPIRNAIRKLLPKFPCRPLVIVNVEQSQTAPAPPALPGSVPDLPDDPLVPVEPETPMPPDQSALGAINARLDELAAAIAAIPAGAKGDAGPIGETGPQGPPGEAATFDPSTLTDEQVESLAKRLPPLYFQAYSPDGTTPVGEPVAKRLGNTVNLNNPPTKAK